MEPLTSKETLKRNNFCEEKKKRVLGYTTLTKYDKWMDMTGF